VDDEDAVELDDLDDDVSEPVARASDSDDCAVCAVCAGVRVGVAEAEVDLPVLSGVSAAAVSCVVVVGVADEVGAGSVADERTVAWVRGARVVVGAGE
jgi:hypothetical protein